MEDLIVYGLSFCFSAVVMATDQDSWAETVDVAVITTITMVVIG